MPGTSPYQERRSVEIRHALSGRSSRVRSRLRHRRSALIGLGDISTGETLLVTGAAGGVGSAAVMIARWKGARVIGAIKDESERPQAERAGVEVIVDTSRENVTDSVLAATDGGGADLVLDAVGGPLFEPALGSLGERDTWSSSRHLPTGSLSPSTCSTSTARAASLRADDLVPRRRR